jgi:hypothetical protein
MDCHLALDQENVPECKPSVDWPPAYRKPLCAEEEALPVQEDNNVELPHLSQTTNAQPKTSQKKKNDSLALITNENPS